MALDSVPAWLDVTPAQFGQAAAEGARLNLSRQELAQRGQEENAKLQMSAAASAAQLGMEQKRLAATEQQMAMQHQLREDMLASNFQRAQTQSAVARAYHEAMIGLGKQRLARTVSLLTRPNAGQTENIERRTEVPAAPATPGSPAQPASKGYLGGMLFGLGAHPAIPAVPAQPAAYKTTLSETMKVPPGTDPASVFKSATATNAPPTATAPKEIVRMTKDGKKAVFDADTKKFLRYAD